MAEVEIPYWVQLERQIKDLNDEFDIHECEIFLLNSEIIDLNKPTLLLNRLMKLHLEMFSEITDYMGKNKVTERITASHSRLLELIDITTQLNGIGDHSRALKSINRELISKTQIVRLENSNLKKELNKITQQDNF